MDDLSFLEYLESDDNATLKAVLPDGQVCHISDSVCPFKFLDHCPLLYHAFESDQQGRLQASIEAASRSSVISLLRFCYTGSYIPDGSSTELFSLLQHAEIYKLASNFDVPALQLAAHGNFSCQIEYICSFPTTPPELAETIRFVYKHFASYESRQEHSLINTLLNYCVSAYHYHKLGDNTEFLEVVAEIPAFRQDLCRTNIARDFADACAPDIIRLHPYPAPELDLHPNALTSENVPSETFDIPYMVSAIICTGPTDPPSPANNATNLSSSHVSSTPTLVLRPKNSLPAADIESETEIICKKCSGLTTQFWRRDETGAALCNECWLFELRYGQSLPVSHSDPRIDTAGVMPRRQSLLELSCGSKPNAKDSARTALCETHMVDPQSQEPQHAPAKESSDETEDEGFSIVHRPKSPTDTAFDECMSSPELIPSIPSGEDCVMHTDSSSDDDWTQI